MTRFETWGPCPQRAQPAFPAKELKILHHTADCSIIYVALPPIGCGFRDEDQVSGDIRYSFDEKINHFRGMSLTNRFSFILVIMLSTNL